MSVSFTRVRVPLDEPVLGGPDGVAIATDATLAACGVALRPGSRVAIAVGSRGIADLVTVVRQVAAWARAQGGWMAFDSSTGFRLPDDAVLSPDTSLVALDRWQALTPEQRRRIPPLCPDLVVELASPSGASPSDEGPRGLTALRQKMAAYQRNGARLGWLLIPQERSVEVWGALAGGAQGQRIEAATRLAAEPPFVGLEIDLAPIWGD